MALLTRIAANTVLSASTINPWADEIERAVRGTFADNDNTARPLVRVRRTSTLAIANATELSVSWQAFDVDPDGMWDAGTPNRITIRTDGIWLISGTLRYSGSAGGDTRILNLNTASTPAGAATTIAENNGTPRAGGTSTIGVVARPFTAGTPIFAIGSQNSGGSLNFETSFGGTWLSAVWLGPL